MSASIFISYASQDQKVATTLCKALEGRNFKCWIAARDIAPGENFQIAIVRAIRAAKIMLLVFTGNSNNSDEMAKELALASQSKLIVVPLLIDDVRPNDAFSYEFATRQWIDFFSDWETAIEQLAQRIAVALGTEAAAAPAAPTAPEPPPPPAPTPDVIMQALAAQPAEVAAPVAQPAFAQPSFPQAAVDPAGQTAMMPPASFAAAAPAPAAFEATGPSSFQDPPPAKRAAPIGLIVALGLLVVVAIAAAAVVLPSFLALKPTPPPVASVTPPVAAPANAATALSTTPAPMPPPPPLVTEPTATTPGPAPLASNASTAPAATPPARLRHFAPAADAPEDPDLDPETHPARGRHHGGDSADVPY